MLAKPVAEHHGLLRRITDGRQRMAADALSVVVELWEVLLPAMDTEEIIVRRVELGAVGLPTHRGAEEDLPIAHVGLENVDQEDRFAARIDVCVGREPGERVAEVAPWKRVVV